MLILFVLLLFGVESVQAADIAVPSVAVSPGGSAAVPVRFVSAGSQVVAVQFDLDVDPALSIAATGGPAALGAGKSLTVADVSPTRKRFLLAGLNQTPLTDGDLVILAISVRSSAVGALPLHLSNLGAADKDGKPLVLSSHDGTVTVAAVATLSYAGGLSQIASGGAWKTTITVVNLTSGQNAVRVNFWGDDGAPLAIPVSFPGGGPSGGRAASIERTLAPNAMIVIDTEEPSAATVAGWAELLSSGDIAAFAVFRFHLAADKETEGAVFLENRTASGFVVPVDTTTGFATGIALENSSSVPAMITMVARDESGNQLSFESMNISPKGHTAFVLADRYPYLAGRRATIEFRNKTGLPFAVLGLRFNPFGFFTAVPVAVAK